MAHPRKSARRLLVLAPWLLMACGGEAEPEGLPASRPPAPTASAAGNEPPEIERVDLQPRDPRPGEELRAEVRASDPEGDSLTLSYRWTVDGEPVEGGAALRLESFQKGSAIEVEVVATDAHGAQSPAVRQRTGVGNQPPVLREVAIEPAEEITVESDVTASPRGDDPDGDVLTFEYRWSVNGREAGTDAALLAKRSFRRGDSIDLAVVADDGNEESEPLRIETIRVMNAEPRITSEPGGFDGDGAFQYRLETEDADGDRVLRYRLVEGPKGMRVDALKGLVTWDPRDDQAGEHVVVIEVDDRAGGTGRQSFALSVAFEAPPAAAAN